MTGARRTIIARRGAPGVLVAVLLAIALLGIPSSAMAHGALRRSEPARGATLDSVPRVLRLVFSEPVELEAARLELLGPAGAAVALSPVRLGPDSAQVLLADVTGRIVAGTYTVVWQVVGRDGHPVRGRFGFTVAPGARGLAAGAAAPTLPGAGEPTASRRADSVSDASRRAAAAAAQDHGGFDAGSPLYVAIRWTNLIALVSLIGVVAFRWLVLGRLARAGGADERALAEGAEARARVLGVVLAVILVATMLARLAAQVAALFGGLGAATASQAAGLLTGTTWGHAWLAQASGAAAVAAALVLARRRSARSAAWTLAAGAAVLLALSSALSGHAAATPRLAGAAIASDAFHVLGAGSWLGTLLVLLAAGLPAARALGPTSRADAAGALARAFSPVALACAAVVVLTGAVNAWLQLGDLAALWVSGYGRTLLLKLALLLPVAAAGAYNWRRVVPALGSDAGAARLRRSAGVELAVAALVLLVTAILVATPTPVGGAQL